jgi:hypothetical protein
MEIPNLFSHKIKAMAIVTVLNFSAGLRKKRYRSINRTAGLFIELGIWPMAGHFPGDWKS